MEVHRVDRDYRNRTVLVVAMTILLCVVLLLMLDVWLRQIDAQLSTSDPDTARRWLRALLAILGIGLAVPTGMVGLGLRRLGLASRIEGRFPPRSWKTLRDVRVLRDAAALRWARRTEAAGTVALGFAMLLLSWAGWAWWRFA